MIDIKAAISGKIVGIIYLFKRILFIPFIPINTHVVNNKNANILDATF